MSEVRCHYSGVPMQVAHPQPGRHYYSCTGCAVAGSVPVDAQGNFPVNGPLIAVLVGGVAFFNQVIIWPLSVMLLRQGKDSTAGHLVTASLAIGLVLWLALVVVQWRVTGGGRRADWLVVVFTALLAVCGLILHSPGCMVEGTALLMVWGARGLLYKKRFQAGAGG
ncbi:MAG: hypothetical protein WC205_05445 [Opitutaceae bacterium]|jgi:hypothetical protein